MYGGNVLDKIKRIHIPEDEHEVEYDSFEYIPTPLRPYLKKISARQKDDDYRSGYFVFKNVLGKVNKLKRQSIFYDVYLLTDSIPSREAYEFLKSYNNTVYDKREKHYFDKRNRYHLYGIHRIIEIITDPYLKRQKANQPEVILPPLNVTEIMA